MIKNFIQQVVTSSFVRSVAVLTTGNLIAQMIPFLILPLYTRMYVPEMFALQALLQVGMLFLAPIATGYYEWAAPSARHQREARALATIAMGSALAVCLLSFLVIATLRDSLAAQFNLQAMGRWIYAYPVIILATATSSISNYWLLRTGNFKRQSINRVVLTAAAAIIALTLGFFHVSEGLLIGFCGGTVISAIWAIRQAYHCGLRTELHLPPRYFLKIIKQYREFPIYGGIPSAFNNLAAQVPLLIITSTYTLGMAGHYAVVRGLLSSGTGLISVCIGQVILKHFADLIHTGQPLWPYYKKISIWIFLVALVVTLGTYFVGPWFFGMYLGKNWQDSTEILRMLSINVLFWLVGPSVAMVAVAIKKLRMIALWQVIYGLMAGGLLLFRDLPFEQFMHRVVLFEAVAYALYFVIMTYTVSRYDNAQKMAQNT